MAGHSKWKNIKHRKSRQDALRGKLFAKLAREIYVAARDGGVDPDMNQALRLAISKAKAANMPNENIERMLQKAQGGTEGEKYEAVSYEGYGPAGVAVLVEALTDNRNRAAANIRHIFSKFGGNLGEAGCVAWMFSRKGSLIIDKEETTLDEDDIMLLALEAGADDFVATSDTYDIMTSVEQFETIKQALEKEGLSFSAAELTMIPHNTIELTGEDATKTLQLMDALDDEDDVQNVYANFDIDDAHMERD